MFHIVFEEQDFVLCLFIAHVAEYFDQVSVGIAGSPVPTVARHHEALPFQTFNLARFNSNFGDLFLLWQKKASR